MSITTCETNTNRFSITNDSIFINDILYPILTPEIYIPDIFRSPNPCQPQNIPTSFFNYEDSTYSASPSVLSHYNNNFVYTINLIDFNTIKAILFSNSDIPLFSQYRGSVNQLYNYKSLLYFFSNDGFTLVDMELLEQYFYYNGFGIMTAMMNFMIECKKRYDYYNNGLQSCSIPLYWESTSSIVVLPHCIERTYFNSIEPNVGNILFRNVFLYLMPPNNPLGSLINIVISVLRDLIFLLRYENRYIRPYYPYPNPISWDVIPGQYIKPYMLVDVQPYLDEYITNENFNECTPTVVA
jgi:hypothetical protein